MELQNYTNENFVQFVEDMLEAGFEEVLRHYHGRFFYEGPAVVVEDVQDAIRATSVRVQWDNLGRSFIVYPRE